MVGYFISETYGPLTVSYENLVGERFYKIVDDIGSYWVNERGDEVPVTEDGSAPIFPHTEPVSESTPVVGQFEVLMEDLERELATAEGGYEIDLHSGRLVIIQMESRNPSLSSNGGDYNYYRNYMPDGRGVKVWNSWSCDIAKRQSFTDRHYDCIISLNGLERLAIFISKYLKYI